MPVTAITKDGNATTRECDVGASPHNWQTVFNPEPKPATMEGGAKGHLGRRISTALLLHSTQRVL
jgi:hypothetical protein